MEDLISVIVPIYNVEKYLEECVQSIINQSYKNIEIILVDDGSPDNCPKICDNFASKDNRIKVIHKKNEGLSAARNDGTKEAKGKYICFIDSDDYIAEDYLEYLYKNIIENDADISEGYLLDFFDGEKPELKNEEIKIKILNSKDAILDLYKPEGCNVVAVNKLYKKELFKNVEYPVGKLHEDVFTTYKVYFEAKKIVQSTKKIYFYRQRPGSITTTFNIKRLVVLDAFKEIEDFYITNGFNDLLIYNYKQALNLILLYYSQINDRDAKQRLFELFKNYLVKYRESEGKKNILLLIRYKLFIFCPKFDKMIIKIKKTIKRERK